MQVSRHCAHCTPCMSCVLSSISTHMRAIIRYSYCLVLRHPHTHPLLRPPYPSTTSLLGSVRGVRVQCVALSLADCPLRTVPCGLSLADCRVRTVACGRSLADGRLRDVACGMSLAGCRLRDVTCGMSLAGCHLRVPIAFSMIAPMRTALAAAIVGPSACGTPCFQFFTSWLSSWKTDLACGP